jgi:hypothetical protein
MINNDYDESPTENANTPVAPPKPKRGRPTFEVTWPQSEFTAEEVHKSLENKLSRVSVHAKINRAISTGELVTVGKIKPKTGRPKMVYKLAASRDSIYE